ncbi:hypothetical protein DCC79_07640, partial [bacterium]
MRRADRQATGPTPAPGTDLQEHNAMHAQAVRLATLVCGAALFAAAQLVPAPSPTHAQAPRATPGRPTQEAHLSQCTGVVTSTLSANTVRICDTVTTTVRLEPACPFCQGGLSIVIIQPDESGANIWSGLVAARMFQELQRYQKEYERAHNRTFLVQAGAIRYDADRPRVALEMTTNLDRARLVVGLAQYGLDQDGGPYPEAAQMAVRMLDGAKRARETNGQPPCMEVIVFFGSREGSTLDTREYTSLVLRAKAVIRARTRNFFLGCTAEATLLCGFFLYMQDNQRYTATKFDAYDVFANIMIREFRDIQTGKDEELVRDVTLTQRLPAGLAYVPGSAIPPPAAVVTATTGETELRWDYVPFRKMG